MVGVPMYLDFAPEPPAPSATPVKVTESVDLNCTPNNDARDLSSKHTQIHKNKIYFPFRCFVAWSIFYIFLLNFILHTEMKCSNFAI